MQDSHTDAPMLGNPVWRNAMLEANQEAQQITNADGIAREDTPVGLEPDLHGPYYKFFAARRTVRIPAIPTAGYACYEYEAPQRGYGCVETASATIFNRD